MPVFIAKHNELKLQEQGQSADDPMEKSIDMLGTIKLPNNMKLIQGNLPTSNYQTDNKKRKGKKDKELTQIDSRKELAQIEEEEGILESARNDRPSPVLRPQSLKRAPA